MLVEKYKDLLPENYTDKEKLKKEINNIDKKIDNFIDRIWATKSETLILNYESKIETLEKEKILISWKINKDIKNVRTPLKRKIKLVRSSLSIWEK